MSEQRKRRTLGEMLDAGERPFVDREKFQQNLPAISAHSETLLQSLPIPAAPGRPRKEREVASTEAITLRLPIQTNRLISAQADELGISRNRWLNIAIRRQLQTPVLESDLKPAIGAEVVLHCLREVSVTAVAKVPSGRYVTIIETQPKEERPPMELAGFGQLFATAIR